LLVVEIKWPTPQPSLLLKIRRRHHDFARERWDSTDEPTVQH